MTSRATASTAPPVDARAHGVDRRLLCLAHHVVDLPQLGRRRAERDRAGHVGVIAAVEAREVHLDHVALFQHPVRGMVMRLGGLLAERHDRLERQPVRAGATQCVLQLQGDLSLGHADREPFQDVVERDVGARLRLVEQRDLLRVLDPPQALDRLAHGDELDVGHLVLQLPQAAHGHVVCFEAQLPDAEPGARLCERLAERVQVRHPLEVGDLVARLFRVPPVGEEHARRRRHDRLRVRAGEARQVTDVGQPRHEHGVDRLLLDRGDQCVAPHSVIHGIASRAR